MDYWLRLDNMVDVADECLRWQGHSIGDLSHEVRMIFIKLISLFKYKSATAASGLPVT